MTAMGLAVPLARSPWHRNVKGDWTRCLPDGSQLTACRSRGRWYWSRCDGPAARYSPAFASEDEAFGAAPPARPRLLI
jgi:hypothetical protein